MYTMNKKGGAQKEEKKPCCHVVARSFNLKTLKCFCISSYFFFKSPSFVVVGRKKGWAVKPWPVGLRVRQVPRSNKMAGK